MTLDVAVEPVLTPSKPVEQVAAVVTSDEEPKTAKRDLSPMLEIGAPEPQAERMDFGVVKPPYRIPAMTEIRASAKNGYTVVSTFSGCGGSSLGFRWAGFTSLWSSEFIPAAADTYHENFPDVRLGVQDIREVSGAMLLELLGLQRGELDVLEGSPPCASFSMAGKRDSHWGEVKAYSDTKQRTDDLLMEYARLLYELQPRAFVMENVPGLVSGKAKGYLSEIMEEFHNAGYSAKWKILDAQWFGVPQRRRRAIFVGFRHDLMADRILDWFPAGFDYNYSIRDALPHLGGAKLDEPGHGYFPGRETSVDEPMIPVRPGSSSGASQPSQVSIVVDQRTSTFSDDDFVYPSLDEPIPTITRQGIGADEQGDWRIVAPTEAELAETNIERYAIGAEWEKLKQGEQSEKYLNLVRPHEDQPLPTVTQTGGVLGAASVTHPSEPRKFTLPELRRLCGFPDDFVLTGSYRQGWERLGRAVPPPLMRAVASRVAEVLAELDS
jgi:DNA (cytosine-5)-methyltransferase 1